MAATALSFYFGIWGRPFGNPIFDGLFYFVGIIFFICGLCFFVGNNLKVRIKTAFAELDRSISGIRYVGKYSIVVSHRKIFYHKPVFFPHVLGFFKIELLCRTTGNHWFIFSLSIRSSGIKDTEVIPIPQDMAESWLRKA
jgi:hypothetical protein